MSKDEKYTNIEIDTSELSEAKQLVLLSLINEGMLRERERIVALLEASLDDDIETDAMHNQNLGIQIAIALIKGEEDGSEPDAA
jgi:hypothetical protein